MRKVNNIINIKEFGVVVVPSEDISMFIRDIGEVSIGGSSRSKIEYLYDVRTHKTIGIRGEDQTAQDGVKYALRTNQEDIIFHECSKEQYDGVKAITNHEELEVVLLGISPIRYRTLYITNGGNGFFVIEKGFILPPYAFEYPVLDIEEEEAMEVNLFKRYLGESNAI